MARSSGGAEPTEAPSARRLLEARRRGFTAVSRDLSEALGLAAFLLAVGVGVAPAVARLTGLFRAVVSAPLADPGAATAALAPRALDVAAALTLVPLSAALVAGVLAAVLQTGGLLAWRAAAPDLGRLSPAAAFARFARGDHLSAVVRHAAKIALIGAAVAFSLASVFPALPALAGAAPRAVLAAAGVGSKLLGASAGAAFVVWGVLDWVLGRRRHQRALMMTRAEATRERKETEGDPHHKASRRRQHREVVERRRADDVRRADFVVRAGDEHRAVAVGYDPAGLRAPTVLAKGERLLAASIDQIARAAGVPIHLDDRLAQALSDVPEGHEIPASTYQAVAELLRASWSASGHHEPPA